MIIAAAINTPLERAAPKSQSPRTRRNEKSADRMATGTNKK